MLRKHFFSNRTKRTKLAVWSRAFVLSISALMLTWLFASALDNLPPEKQVFEDRYALERTQGNDSPASKDDIPTPEPGADFQYPTGIINDTESPFSSQDFIILNRWQGLLDGNLLIVYAGYLASDPTQGVVIVGVLSDDPNEVSTQSFLTPTKSGGVRITTVHNLQFALMSTSGNAFLFDLPTRTFLTVVTVRIDIKPGMQPNPINLGARGMLPVAILSTTTFDATTVNPQLVQFGPNGAPSVRSSKEDVNKDGRLDLLILFDNKLTGIAVGDTQACILGQDNIGSFVSGCDSIVVVPPRN